MNRQPRRSPRKVQVENLESRLLLSLVGEPPLPIRAAAFDERAIHQQMMASPPPLI